MGMIQEIKERNNVSKEVLIVLLFILLMAVIATTIGLAINYWNEFIRD